MLDLGEREQMSADVVLLPDRSQQLMGDERTRFAMTGFGDFFDNKLTEREIAIKAEKDARETALRERAEHIKATKRPFLEVYEPVRDAAVRELSIKGIELDDDAASSSVFSSGHIFSKSFKLKMNLAGKEKIVSSTHGFLIDTDGFVEAYKYKRDGGRYVKAPFYRKHATDITSEDVERVIRSAIESLVKRI